MSTLTACLTRVGRIDRNVRAPSFFRFGCKLVEELRPRGICNAFGKTMVVRHAGDMQVFHTDDTETVNDLTRLLVGEIVTPEGNPFMYTSDHLAMLPALRCACSQFRVRALHLCQCLLFLTKKARVGDGFPRGERRKGRESDINAHLGLKRLKALGFTLDRETHVPFVGPALVNGTGFDRALDGPMIDHLETANLGEGHVIIMGDAEATLREGEAIVAVSPTETREARRLSGLTSTEEGFESQINAYGDILQDLRMDGSEGRMLFFQEREGGDLPIAGQAFASVLIGIFALLKQVVIEPPTLTKGVGELGSLFLCRVHAILKVFMHTPIVYTNRAGNQAGSRSTPAPSKERFSSPA